MTRRSALVLILVTAVAVPALAVARPPGKVTLQFDQGRPVVGTKVLVSGRAKGAKQVRLERKKAGKWQVVKWVTVRKGRFSTTIRARKAGRTWRYRAVMSGTKSKVKKLRVQPEPMSNPPLSPSWPPAEPPVRELPVAEPPVLELPGEPDADTDEPSEPSSGGTTDGDGSGTPEDDEAPAPDQPGDGPGKPDDSGPTPEPTPEPAPAPDPDQPSGPGTPDDDLSTDAPDPSLENEPITGSDPEPDPEPVIDDCGLRPAKTDGSLWSCSFFDDFDGPELDRTKWVPQTQFATGTANAFACYADDESVIDQSGGILQLSIITLETPTSCAFGGLSGETPYLAGSVMTHRLFSQQYGRFEAKIRNQATTAPGLHEAFWLWPDDRYPSDTYWPFAGEIDISETYSSHPNLAIPFLHYAADALGAVPGLNTAWHCIAARGEWNTYTLEWSETALKIAVNGQTCLINTSGDAAFNKPYIMALTQLMGTTGNEYDGRAPLPATMEVAYVRVWK